MPILDLDAATAFRNLNRQDHSRWSALVDVNGTASVGSGLYRPNLSQKCSIGTEATGFVLGSCFAQELQHALRMRGFALRSVINEAPKKHWFIEDQSNYWPLHFFHRYNPPSMLQEVENILGESAAISGGELIFEDPEGHFRDYHYHSEFALETFEDCMDRRTFIRRRIDGLAGVEFAVLTLGLVEAWLDLESGLYLNTTPNRLYKNRPLSTDLLEKFPNRFRFQVLGESEVFDRTKRMLELLYSVNASMTVVLTVSPIPLEATFTGEDVVTANANSKATLLCAANRLRREFPRMFYFPAYEIVTHSNRAMVWETDGRHVRREFVENLMNLFTSEIIATG